MIGPYRQRLDPSHEPDFKALLGAVRRRWHRCRRAHRAVGAFGLTGYLVAAWCAGQPVDGGGARGTAIVWAPIAAVATCAVITASRARAHGDDLEAEITRLERWRDAGDG